MNNSHIQFMQKALSLAEKGLGTVSPNPMVGSILVNENGEVIGKGYHAKKGEAHAEVNAIKNALDNGHSLEGSTLYCTLEPCCHTNKTTPPCTEFIIEKGIKKVVLGCLDPNPEVSGKGVDRLKSADINVTTGVLEEECKSINDVFFINMKEKRPFIHLKIAATLDGRIATSSGSSRWITSDVARKEVHQMRHSYDAVMIGKGTLRADNPKLTSRENGKVLKDPIKVVVGNLNESDLSLDLFKNLEKVINIHTEDSKIEGLRQIKHNGSWQETFKNLMNESVSSILVEGGAKLLSGIIAENIFDKYSCYLAPKLIGNGPSLFGSDVETNMENARRLNGSWRILSSNEVVFEGAR